MLNDLTGLVSERRWFQNWPQLIQQTNLTRKKNAAIEPATMNRDANMAKRMDRVSGVADAAINSGEGVSPAAKAAAIGSPPGNDADTTATDSGLSDGSGDKQRRIDRSTAGSISLAWPESAWCVGRLLVKPSQFGDGRCVMYGHARKEFKEDKAQRVNVAPNTRLATQQLFRCHVSRSSGHSGNVLTVSCYCSQSKVRNPHLTLPIDHDVRRFEVAMQHSFVCAAARPAQSCCAI